MLPLIGLEGYHVSGFETIGRHGRPLKPDRRNVYTLQAGSATFAVASPVASIKWHINQAIHNGRKKRVLSFKEQ